VEQFGLVTIAVIAGVGDDDVSSGGEGLFDFRGNTGIHGGEDKLGGIARPGVFHLAGGDIGGRRAPPMPFGGFGVALAGGTLAGTEPRQMKQRMPVEKLNEMLAHHSGSAKDTYFNSAHLELCLPL
jgi:hypothetical protein